MLTKKFTNMKKIKSYKQFNESNSQKDLDLKEELEIKSKLNSNIELMSDSQLNLVFSELEKITEKLNCSIEDLTDVDFVKNNLYNIIHNSTISEGFFSDIKNTVLRIFSKFFEWGSAIGSIVGVIISSINGNFWGIIVSAIAFVITGLASAYISRKINP